MNKREVEVNKTVKLPFVTTTKKPTAEKPMLVSGRFHRLPRLEKARSFIQMPIGNTAEQQLVLSKLISVKLLRETSSIYQSQQQLVMTRFKSFYVVNNGEEEVNETAAAMNFQLVSTIRRESRSDGENDDDNSKSYLVKKILPNYHHHINNYSNNNNEKIYMMKKYAVYAHTSTAKIVEQAKQTSACSNLSRVVQTCLSGDRKWVYVIREYATETFDDLIRRYSRTGGRLVSTKSLKQWLLQSLSALEFLHTNLNACHSNLKPSNLLLVGLSQLKLADFHGVFSSDDLAISRLISRPRNRTYLPVETLISLRYSNKSDVYSLAAVFYELICLSLTDAKDEKLLKSRLRSNTPIGDEYIGNLLMTMLCSSDVDRPNSSELIALLRFFDSIDFIRKLSDSKMAYVIKLKQYSNDKKMFLKVYFRVFHCLF